MAHIPPLPRDPDLPWPGRVPEPPADITGIEMVEVPQDYGRHHDRLVPQGAAASAAVLLAIPVAILVLMLIILELV